MKKVATLLLVLLISACSVDVAPPADPTPTQEILPGLLGPGFVVINANPGLNAPLYEDGNQVYPHGYTLYNDLHNVLGGQDQYTRKAPVTRDGRGLFFDIVAVAGTWGLKTEPVVIAPSCLVIRADGWASVVEIAAYTRNVKLVALITINGEEFPLAEHDLPLAPGAAFEFIWPVRAVGTVQVTVAVRAHYATASPGTEVILSAVYVAIDEDGDHCE